MMNRESVELGYILKRIDSYDFSMNEFSDRLKLQKMIYLLQAFDVYLGYDFSWYLRGPYCSVLAHNGFHLQTIYDRVPDSVDLKNKRDRKNFERFLKFVRNKTVDELEIASSLHYLKTIHGNGGGMSDGEILEKTANKQKRFTREQTDAIWKEMSECRLV